jgi:hypothetical protein
MLFERLVHVEGLRILIAEAVCGRIVGAHILLSLGIKGAHRLVPGDVRWSALNLRACRKAEGRRYRVQVFGASLLIF